MRNLRCATYGLSGLAALAFAGCGFESQSGTPSVPSRAQYGVQAPSSSKHLTSGQRVLYVLEEFGSELVAATYPQGKKIITIYLQPYYTAAGECTDGKGNDWVVGNGELFRYDARSPKAGKVPRYEVVNGCAVDPTTGNLAGTGIGSVFIWLDARGKPKRYKAKWDHTFKGAGYDNQGNLFVDGQERFNGDFLFAELARGSSKLQKITLDQSIGAPGQVQWDGQYVAIQDAAAPHDIYQVRVSGTMGTIVRTIHFSGLGKHVGASWIDGDTVLIPFDTWSHKPKIGFFNYPAGGEATQIVEGRPYRYLDAVAVTP